MRTHAPISCTVLVLFSACSSSPPPARVPAPELTLERVVRFEHRLVNKTDRPARIEMFLAVPQSNERQTVRYFVADPSPAEELVDEYGNRILHYVDDAVPAGGVVAHGWMAEVAVSSFDAVATPIAAELSPAERERLLRDSANYRLDSETIRALAAKLQAGCSSDDELVRRAYTYLIEEVRYVRDDVWDPAPMVIERGTGSCSEFNYALVALCRAAGIPTRWTGGLVLRTGDQSEYDPRICEDAVFHRWTEALLPEHGWFPVDCSRGSSELRRFGNPGNYFGRLPAGLLQCVRGDGAGDSPLEWDYLSSYRVPYDDKDWSGKVGFWLEGVPEGALGERVAAVRSRLAAAQDRKVLLELVREPLDREILFLHRNLLRADAIPALVDALLEVQHPEAIYWSLLAQHRGIDVQAERDHRTFCDPYLLEQIERYYVPERGGQGLFSFEYWWRKARPETRWSKGKRLFELTNRAIDIY